MYIWTLYRLLSKRKFPQSMHIYTRAVRIEHYIIHYFCLIRSSQTQSSKFSPILEILLAKVYETF